MMDDENNVIRQHWRIPRREEEDAGGRSDCGSGCRIGSSKRPREEKSNDCEGENEDGWWDDLEKAQYAHAT